MALLGSAAGRRDRGPVRDRSRCAGSWSSCSPTAGRRCWSPRTATTVAADTAAGCGVALLGPAGSRGAGPTPEPAAPGGGEHIALLIYTSGSTGTPRGVQLSHRALLANREQTAALRPAPVTPVDRVLLALPLFHVYGLAAGFLQVCWAGATVVLTERLGRRRSWPR